MTVWLPTDAISRPTTATTERPRGKPVRTQRVLGSDPPSPEGGDAPGSPGGVMRNTGRTGRILPFRAFGAWGGAEASTPARWSAGARSSSWPKPSLLSGRTERFLLSLFTRSAWRHALVSRRSMRFQQRVAPIALSLILASMAACDSAPQSEAEALASYPNRPIVWLVAFDPGGGSDLEARRVQAALEEKLGTSIQVQYRSGGGGAVGWSELTGATPDGYTVGGLVDPPHSHPAAGARRHRLRNRTDQTRRLSRFGSRGLAGRGEQQVRNDRAVHGLRQGKSR